MMLDALVLISFSFIFNFHFKWSKATAQLRFGADWVSFSQ